MTPQSSYWITRKLGLLTRRGRPSWVVCCGKLPKMGSPILYFLSTQQVTQGTQKMCTLPIQYVPYVFSHVMCHRKCHHQVSWNTCLLLPDRASFHMLSGPFNAGYHAGSPFSDLGLFLSMNHVRKNFFRLLRKRKSNLITGEWAPQSPQLVNWKTQDSLSDLARSGSFLCPYSQLATPVTKEVLTLKGA